MGQEFLIYKVTQSGSSCIMYIRKKVASEFSHLSESLLSSYCLPCLPCGPP